MKELKKCAICGVTRENKIIAMVHGVPMCSKHKAQFYRHGKIIDETPRTTQDKNQIVIHNDYAEVIIYDKTNKKEQHALIDIEDVPKVSQRKWRIEYKSIEKMGYVVSGTSRKKRTYLHRLVMNYAGSLEVDHINRNTLDNRKCNLRIVPKIINEHNKTTRNNHIEQIKNKFRVKIIRFKREFIFGLFDTAEEARRVRDEFLDFIAMHEEEIIENYNKENFSGKKTTTFINDKNRLVHTKMFKTVEEAIQNREDFRALLKEISKTA